MSLLSDEEILHRVDTHVGEPNQKYPLNGSDWKNFARAIEAAILAKLASAELLPVQDLSDEEKQFIHCNPDTDDLVELIQDHAAAYGRQAYAQGFAAGAAAQLAEMPVAFFDVVMDCAYTMHELGGEIVDSFTPLYTRREA